jgi:hypothetical protein
VLEGGYDPVNVANGAEAVFIAATGSGESEAVIQIRTGNRIARRASGKYVSGMDSNLAPIAVPSVSIPNGDGDGYAAEDGS